MKLVPAVVLASLATIISASSGDRDQQYVRCVELCDLEQCISHSRTTLPWALRLTRWTCTDDCKYECMHIVMEKAVREGNLVLQYYGKWPFWRFAGMQEPASVAFSILNLWAHAKGAQKIRVNIPQDHPMRSYYFLWAIASMNAWIWSSVFHTRDLPITEKLDYFSAALAILYALYYTIIRLFHLYPPPSTGRTTLSSRPPKSLKQKVLALTCIITYLAHVSYLTLLPRFDYTYNMAFNLILGLTHNVLWAVYSMPASRSYLQRFPSRPKSYRPEFVSQAAFFVVLTTAATALELFDFPPWGGIIDAHALWHLSTVPIAWRWYDFLVADSLDPSWREQRP